MINRVILVGRLTKEPELRRTQGGASVVSFSLAVNRRVQTPGQPEADFFNCVAWNKLAETMAQYLHKGSLIGLEGRLQARSYDNQQGQRVHVVEVVAESIEFLEPKSSRPQTAQTQTQAQGNRGGYQQQNAGYQNRGYQQVQQPQSTQQAQRPDYGFIYGSDAQEPQTYENGSVPIASSDLPF